MMESLILKEIKENKENWEEHFANNYPDILIKKDGNFAIFNYGIQADFNLPIIQEARGIIIDIEKEEVACWPFRKFGKYYDDYADKIDWSTAKVQEKLDGSIIKLWFNKYTNEWQFSTNSTINAKDANLPAPYSHLTFYDLIIKAMEENSELDFDILNKDCTYIFELTAPENRVVVAFVTHKLWAIGARNNRTGEEFEPNIGIARPPLYPYTNVDECIHIIDRLNNDKKLTHVDFEGFVVVDANWNRVKIKTPIYMTIHGLAEGTKQSKEALLYYIFNNKIDVGSLCEDFPDLAHIIKWYDYQLSEALYRIRTLIDIANKMVDLYDNNMSVIGKLLSKEQLSSFAFKAIKQGKSFEEIMGEMNEKGITKLVPDYPKIDRSYLFQYKE